MSTVYEMIQKIRARPKMFLGHPSVNNLYVFLTGFTYARKDDGVGDFDFLAGFGQWVHDRYRITSTQSWAQIIQFFSTCEEDELPLCWKLMDQYIASQKPRQKKVS